MLWEEKYSGVGKSLRTFLEENAYEIRRGVFEWKIPHKQRCGGRGKGM